MTARSARPARYSVEDTPSGLLVTVRSDRPGCVIAFLSLWLVGWTLGEYSAVRALLLGEGTGFLGLFLVVWIAGWTAGGLAALVFWALAVDGTQLVAIDGVRLVDRIEAFGVGRDRAYELARARRMHIGADPGDDGSAPSFVLRFEYDGRTVDLVKGLDEPELTRLAEEIVRRYPTLGTGRPTA